MTCSEDAWLLYGHIYVGDSDSLSIPDIKTDEKSNSRHNNLKSLNNKI